MKPKRKTHTPISCLPGLYFKRPTLLHLAIMAVLTIFEFLYLTTTLFQEHPAFEFVTFLMIIWVVLGGGFGNALRNVCVLGWWWVLSGILLFAAPEPFPAAIPLAVSIYVHIARITYRLLFGHEPIFVMVEKNVTGDFDAVENRKSRFSDGLFSAVTLAVGAILVIVLYGAKPNA